MTTNFRRHFLAALGAGLAVALALALPATTAAQRDAGRVRVVAWSSKTTKAGLPPADAVSGDDGHCEGDVPDPGPLRDLRRR